MRTKTFIFIYSRKGEVKVLNSYDSTISEQTKERKKWKHTATIEPCMFIEYLCNRCTDEQIIEEINELKQ